MKKAFVWDPMMRSSAIKYDPCVSFDGKTGKIKCDNCTITLIADRFLGKEFQKEILSKIGASKGKYPYVIIADSLGCNLRCWFCYAYKFFTKEDAEKNKCHIAYVCPQELAQQFGCKIEKLFDLKKKLLDNNLSEIFKSKNFDEQTKEKIIKHLKMNLPLMRIRISGGEPIFSNKDTLRLDQSDKDTLPDSSYTEYTIRYWLLFFEELDKIIGRLKEEGKINIVNKKDIKNKDWKGESYPLICIAEREKRLNVRYDTNGIIFSIKDVTEKFIGGLFDLFKEGKLNHLFIEFDYSFKGATPVEYKWSQRMELPVDPSKISFEYDPKDHPQIPGYLNIRDTIEKYQKEDENFYNCVGITVEKGINHNLSFKTYVNCKESLDWEKFSEKTGIKFSVVDNPIEMFNWRNYRPQRYYIKNGASIKVVSDDEEFDLRDSPDMNKFSEFVQSHKNCSFVIYPIPTVINLKNTKKREIKFHSCQKTLMEMQVCGWVFSGTKDNWEIALQKRKWGVKEKHRFLWEKIKPGDMVLFYVTSPISRIIGFGKVKETCEESSLLWPDEIKENNLKYPLRIIFEDIKCLKKENWGNGIKPFDLEIRHGINRVSDPYKFQKILNSLKQEMEKENPMNFS
ncbi:MAG: EVE domain-containing protein [Candidatus Aenigmatarchaeota archaeon]